MTTISLISINTCAKTNFPKLEKEVLISGSHESETLFKKWEKMVEKAKKLPEIKKINMVNNFFNQEIDYQQDIHLYRISDHWASIAETLRLAQGDCEDYVIAKYVTLRILNIDDAKLKLKYVVHESEKKLTPHMVLVYQKSIKSPKMVLDNINTSIKNLNDRKDLSVRYAFNANRVWIGISSYAFHQVKNKFVKWHEVLSKTAYSGINFS